MTSALVYLPMLRHQAHQCGQIGNIWEHFKVFGNILRVNLVFGKILNWLGQNFLVANEEILSIQSCHLVTLFSLRSCQQLTRLVIETCPVLPKERFEASELLRKRNLDWTIINIVINIISFTSSVGVRSKEGVVKSWTFAFWSNVYFDIQTNQDLPTYQCDQKKSPNVYKSCPKMISLEK